MVLFLAIIALLGWLSTRYHFSADWTAAGRHTLSETSTMVLENLDGPVEITAFARDTELSQLRHAIAVLVGRYTRANPAITLTFIDPDREPDRVRELGIQLDGELVLFHRGRREHVRQLTEQSLTNALQRLARGGDRRVFFLDGHGERRPDGIANHDYSSWTAEFEAQGLHVEPLNLAEIRALPARADLLVIAAPRVDLLPGELALIEEYLEGGGNLLWLSDSDETASLAPIAEWLGIERGPGIVVDPTTQLLGIDRPDFVLVTAYPRHPITSGFAAATLYPRAVPVTVSGDGWQAAPLLVSAGESWAETGSLADTVQYDEGSDHPGPITIALALSRGHPVTGGEEQRIVIAGDADFLSNAYLGNGGNRELGTRLVNWLANDDAMVRIPPRTAPDLTLAIGPTATVILGFGFLLVVPAALVAAGLTIWYRRRRR